MTKISALVLFWRWTANNQWLIALRAKCVDANRTYGFKWKSNKLVFGTLFFASPFACCARARVYFACTRVWRLKPARTRIQDCHDIRARLKIHLKYTVHLYRKKIVILAIVRLPGIVQYKAIASISLIIAFDIIQIIKGDHNIYNV